MYWPRFIPIILRCRGLVKNLTDAASAKGRWQTTQENAFAFLAIGKILKQDVDAEYTGTITIDGERLAEFGPADQRHMSKDWGGKTGAFES